MPFKDISYRDFWQPFCLAEWNCLCNYGRRHHERHLCESESEAQPFVQFKVTTDTNNHNSCMTKHILPYNFNICYGIYLKITGINGLSMPGANKCIKAIYKFQQELLPLFIILPLFCMGKLQKSQ